MNRASIVAAMVLPTTLAGCNLAPLYVRPASPVPVELPQGGVYPRAATDAPDVSRVGWRDFFTDPRLGELIQTALDHNRDLRIAAANVLQARAQYRVQRADLLPTIDASGSASYSGSIGSGRGNGAASGGTGGTSGGTGGSGTGSGNIGSGTGGTGSSGTQHNYSLDVGLSAFEVDLFGRVRNLSKAAQERYFASEEGQRAARITLIAEVANAWLTMSSDQDQLRLSHQTLSSFEESRRLTNAQFRIGIKSELEARQADTSYQGARNDIAVLMTRVAQDQNSLNLLVGTTAPPRLLPAGLDDHQTTRDALPGDLSSEVLLRRPDVLQAEHLLIAENANIGAARAAFFPTISITALLGTASSALTGLFSGGSFSYSATPSFSLPLFDAGRNRGNLAYARASQQAAVATYERSIQTAFREVADALALLGTIGEQIDAQTARAQSARVAAHISDARYRAGVDSFLVALDAQRTLYAAQQQLVTSRLSRANNLVELYRALGGGTR